MIYTVRALLATAQSTTTSWAVDTSKSASSVVVTRTQSLEHLFFYESAFIVALYFFQAAAALLLHRNYPNSLLQADPAVVPGPRLFGQHISAMLIAWHSCKEAEACCGSGVFAGHFLLLLRVLLAERANSVGSVLFFSFERWGIAVHVFACAGRFG